MKRPIIAYRFPVKLSFIVAIVFAVLSIVIDREASAWQTRNYEGDNIVMILVDDLGIGDFNPRNMPRVTELMKSRGTSLKLYTCQNCVPTRAALLTGLEPSRMNLHGVSAFFREAAIPANKTLLPELMQERGYLTCAIGKWHLGRQEKNAPANRGFDEFLGFSGGLINSFGMQKSGRPFPDGRMGHDHNFSHDMQINGSALHTTRYSSFLFRDAARSFISKADRRFFLYVAFNAPHAPYQAPVKYFNEYAKQLKVTAADRKFLFKYPGGVLGVDGRKKPVGGAKHRLERTLYLAMVRALDDAIADIYQQLEDSDKARKTLFVFASDNGGVEGIASNGVYRKGKGSPYEGGHRVANAVIWPRVIEPGQEVDQRIWIGDLYPTFANIAGIPRAAVPATDGGDATRALVSNKKFQRGMKRSSSSFVSHVDKRYRPSRNFVDAQFAVHFSDYKYIRFFRMSPDGKKINSVVEQLYDVESDPSENRNLLLKDQYAEQVRRGRLQFNAWGGSRKMLGIATIRPADRVPNGFVTPTEWGGYEFQTISDYFP